MRAFVAIELDPPITAALAAFIRSQLRVAGVRWTPASQLHLTLKFLGEIPRSSVSRVTDITRAAAEQIAPFTLEIGGVGGFPVAHAPRVLWIGVNDADRGAARWLAAADPQLVALGIPAEERAFQPHITLGRAKTRDESSELGMLLKTVVPPPKMTMRVRDVVLFESVLSPAGPRYNIVQRVPFGSA